MQIYLIRHPPPSNDTGLCYGRMDVAVAPQALNDAVESIKARIPEYGVREALVYSSPSTRCLELARQIAAPREPMVSEDLMEMDFGDWQGLAWDSLPRTELDAWANALWDYRPGGGESAEMVNVRWQRWLSQVRPAHSKIIIVITHAGLIRVAVARSGQLGREEALSAAVPFGSIHVLDVP